MVGVDVDPVAAAGAAAPLAVSPVDADGLTIAGGVELVSEPNGTVDIAGDAGISQLDTSAVDLAEFATGEDDLGSRVREATAEVVHIHLRGRVDEARALQLGLIEGAVGRASIERGARSRLAACPGAGQQGFTERMQEVVGRPVRPL